MGEKDGSLLKAGVRDASGMLDESRSRLGRRVGRRNWDTHRLTEVPDGEQMADVRNDCEKCRGRRSRKTGTLSTEKRGWGRSV